MRQQLIVDDESHAHRMTSVRGCVANGFVECSHEHFPNSDRDSRGNKLVLSRGVLFHALSPNARKHSACRSRQDVFERAAEAPPSNSHRSLDQGCTHASAFTRIYTWFDFTERTTATVSLALASWSEGDMFLREVAHK